VICSACWWPSVALARRWPWPCLGPCPPGAGSGESFRRPAPALHSPIIRVGQNALLSACLLSLRAASCPRPSEPAPRQRWSPDAPGAAGSQRQRPRPKPRDDVQITLAALVTSPLEESNRRLRARGPAGAGANTGADAWLKGESCVWFGAAGGLRAAVGGKSCFFAPTGLDAGMTL